MRGVLGNKKATTNIAALSEEFYYTIYCWFLYILFIINVYISSNIPFVIINRGLLKSKKANTKFTIPQTQNNTIDNIDIITAVLSALTLIPIVKIKNNDNITPLTTVNNHRRLLYSHIV